MSNEPQNANEPNEPNPPSQPPTGGTSDPPTPTQAAEPAPAATQSAPDPNAPVFAPGTPGIPSYLQGKNAQQVAEVLGQLDRAVVTGQTIQMQPATPQPQYQQPAAQQAPQQNAPAGPPPADLWISDPGLAAQQQQAYIEQRLTAQVQPTLTQNFQSNAQMARQLAVQANGDAFNRWGHEIDIAMNSMPVESRTFEMYQQAVELIKGRHSEELVNERAEALAKERLEQMAAGTLRSGSAADGASALPDNVLDLESDAVQLKVREDFHHNRIDMATVDEFLRTRRPYGNIPIEQAREKYLTAIKNKQASTAEVN